MPIQPKDDNSIKESLNAINQYFTDSKAKTKLGKNRRDEKIENAAKQRLYVDDSNKKKPSQIKYGKISWIQRLLAYLGYGNATLKKVTEYCKTHHILHSDLSDKMSKYNVEHIERKREPYVEDQESKSIKNLFNNLKNFNKHSEQPIETKIESLDLINTIQSIKNIGELLATVDENNKDIITLVLDLTIPDDPKTANTLRDIQRKFCNSLWTRAGDETLFTDGQRQRIKNIMK